MQFRWAVGIALWSMLLGPVLGPPLPPAPTKAATLPRPVDQHAAKPPLPHR